MNLGDFYRFKGINGVDSVIIGPIAPVEAIVILIGELAAKDIRKERV